MTAKPIVVGITGSIGMGKTETAKMFARLGIPVFDADAAVRALYEPGGAAVPEIATVFPDCVIGGRVDRAKLAERIELDPKALGRLEAIVHPLVSGEQRRFLDECAAEGAEIAILDIPLLFETGLHRQADAVVVVSAPREIQRARVLARRGMSEEKLDRLLARQTPDAEKRAQAHFTVETGEGFDHAFEQVKRIAAELRREKRRA